MTPVIPAYGTYGAMLSSVISTPLPSGVFKVVVDGGAVYSAVEVLQFNGTSATALQVAYDSAPGLSASSASLRRANGRNTRMMLASKPVFAAPEKQAHVMK